MSAYTICAVACIGCMLMLFMVVSAMIFSRRFQEWMTGKPGADPNEVEGFGVKVRGGAALGVCALLVVVVIVSMKSGLAAVQDVQQKNGQLSGENRQLTQQKAELTDKTQYLALSLNQQQKGAQTLAQVASAETSAQPVTITKLRIGARSFGDVPADAKPVSVAVRLGNETLATKKVEAASTSAGSGKDEQTLTLTSGIPLAKISALHLRPTGAAGSPEALKNADTYLRLEGQLPDGRWVALNNAAALTR